MREAAKRHRCFAAAVSGMGPGRHLVRAAHDKLFASASRKPKIGLCCVGIGGATGATDPDR